jgi:Protein of unknown function (DUF1360)
VWKSRACRVNVTKQVGLEDGPEHVCGHVLEPPVSNHSSTVDPYVDTAETIHGASRKVGDLSFVADVRLQPNGLGPDGFALPSDLLEGRPRPSSQHQPRAASGEGKRGGTPDPARGARDHNGTSRQVTSHATGVPSPPPRQSRGVRAPVAGTQSVAMQQQRVQDVPPFEGHSSDQDRPLGGYAALMAIFAAVAGGFSAWISRSRREVPERPSLSDLALVTVATHKASRLLAKDRVASTVRAPFTEFEGDAGPGEISESARGRGLRRAVGELVTCPYCLGVWVAAAFAAGLVVAPRPTRWAAGVMAAVFGSDVLQIVYKNAEDTL